MFSLAVGCMLLVALELFLLSAVLIHHLDQKISPALAVLLAWTGLSFLTLLLLELLSVFRLLTPGPLYTAWGAVAGGLFIPIFRLRKQARQGWEKTRGWLGELWRGATWMDGGLLLGLLAALGLLAFVAFVYPPNNYDSMTYHLPRVMHWAQNQSLAPYTTAIERQVQLQPFAEYMLLNLYLLSGTDRLFNFVQWSALLASLAGVSVILGLFTTEKKLAWAVIFLALSIPMGLAQAVTTQNDLVSSAFALCFIAFGYRLVRKAGWFWSAATAISLGLALLTKSSTLMFLSPFILYFAITLLWHYKAHALAWGAGIGLLAAVIYAPYSLRIIQVYGHFGGPTQHYRNEVFGLNVLAANTLKNFALNFTPEHDSSDGNWIRQVQQQLAKAHQWTGLSATDKRINWELQAQDPFKLVNAVQEDQMANPMHAGLMALATLILVVRTVWVRDEAGLYAFLALAGYLLFAGVFRWQPWGNRLLLPAFYIWCPAVALLIFRRFPAVLILVGAAALTWLGWTTVRDSEFRPLEPPLFREEGQIQLVFATAEHLRQPYEAMMGAIDEKNCEKIGLAIGPDTQEYPLWRLMKRYGIDGTIEHIGVANQTQKFSRSSAEICAVIADSEWGEVLVSGSWEVQAFARFDLYLKQ